MHSEVCLSDCLTLCNHGHGFSHYAFLLSRYKVIKFKFMNVFATQCLCVCFRQRQCWSAPVLVCLVRF